MPICKHCNKSFPNYVEIDNEKHCIASRRFCLECSPFRGNNTRSYILDIPEDKAFCSRCQYVKSNREFYKIKNGNPLSYCINCQREVKNIKFEEKVELIIDMFNGVCFDCGMSYPTPVYCFYDNGRVYKIGKLYNMSLDKAKDILKDCQMICKNCCAMREWINHH